MFPTNLSELDTWDDDSGTVNVVIETVKGSRNKLKYDADRGVFLLHNVLPEGSIFPFNFGFIPSTKGDDGDPLDILVLMDEPTVAGCVIPSRLIGVIEAEQTEDRKTIRNDRILVVAHKCHSHPNVLSIHEMDKYFLKEIEEFFISYHKVHGQEFRPLGYRGPRRADKLVRKGHKLFTQGDDANGQTPNSKPKKARCK